MADHGAAPLCSGCLFLLAAIPFRVSGARVISGKILRLLSEWQILTWLVIALLAAGCFALVQFLLKDRIVVAFDDANLYIFRFKDQQEQALPLRKLIGIALRSPSVEMGAYWFRTYSLTFTGDAGEQERVR